ncbi:MAG: hypothetical protein ACM3ST_03060 [Bdellovibrio bacteriovorus]
MYLRILLVALGVTVALSACSLDQVLRKDATESAPSAAAGGSATRTSATGAAAGSPVPREKAVEAATKALGAEVVVKPGQYLLCRTTDEYKGRTTHYYTCRERRCVGQESAATDIKAPKTKSGCLSTCRGLEKKGKGGALRSYCAS